MTVKELKEKIVKLPDDMPVVLLDYNNDDGVSGTYDVDAVIIAEAEHCDDSELKAEVVALVFAGPGVAV